jgi:hypothetical protein
MEPICIGAICVELGLEIGGLVLAAVGTVATIMHHLHHRAHQKQRERHHQEMRALHERSQPVPSSSDARKPSAGR